MPLVVVDTSVSLPATLSPRGLPRKFWIVLAYGALTYRAEHLRLELAELEREAEHGGGEVGGGDVLERLVARAEAARGLLEERLPYGTPADWVAAGGAYLFDEYERKLRDVGPRLGIDIDRRDARRLRRQLQAVCVSAPPPFAPGDAPALTLDPADDPIVYTALSADADLLVSDDRHIVPRSSGGSHLYEHGDRRLLAVTFDELLRAHLVGVAWDDIQPEWLVDADRLVSEPDHAS